MLLHKITRSRLYKLISQSIIHNVGNNNRFKYLFLTIFLFVGLLHIPGSLHKIYLDNSWRYFFDYAWVHNLQCGKDYIFTYGPLFPVFSPVANSGLFWGKFIISNLFILMIVWLFSVYVIKTLKVQAMIIFTITLVSCREAWPYVAVFMLCSGLPRRCLPAYWKILSLSILGCLPLIKFSYGMVMLPCLILSGIALVVSEKKKSISKLVVGIVVIIVSFLLCWLACGQSPAYLLAYFKGSFEIARGFSGSMGSSLSSTEPLLDITLAGVTSVFMFAPLISNLVADCTKEYKLKAICRRLISDNGVFMLLMGLVYVFFCFKASFTRQDSSHTTQWMYILPVAVLLFVAMAGKFRHIPGKNLF